MDDRNLPFLREPRLQNSFIAGRRQRFNLPSHWSQGIRSSSWRNTSEGRPPDSLSSQSAAESQPDNGLLLQALRPDLEECTNTNTSTLRASGDTFDGQSSEKQLEEGTNRCFSSSTCPGFGCANVNTPFWPSAASENTSRSNNDVKIMRGSSSRGESEFNAGEMIETDEKSELESATDRCAVNSVNCTSAQSEAFPRQNKIPWFCYVPQSSDGVSDAEDQEVGEPEKCFGSCSGVDCVAKLSEPRDETKAGEEQMSRRDTEAVVWTAPTRTPKAYPRSFGFARFKPKSCVGSVGNSVGPTCSSVKQPYSEEPVESRSAASVSGGDVLVSDASTHTAGDRSDEAAASPLPPADVVSSDRSSSSSSHTARVDFVENVEEIVDNVSPPELVQPAVIPEQTDSEVAAVLLAAYGSEDGRPISMGPDPEAEAEMAIALSMSLAEFDEQRLLDETLLASMREYEQVAEGDIVEALFEQETPRQLSTENGPAHPTVDPISKEAELEGNGPGSGGDPELPAEVAEDKATEPIEDTPVMLGSDSCSCIVGEAAMTTSCTLVRREEAAHEVPPICCVQTRGREVALGYEKGASQFSSDSFTDSSDEDWQLALVLGRKETQAGLRLDVFTLKLGWIYILVGEGLEHVEKQHPIAIQFRVDVDTYRVQVRPARKFVSNLCLSLKVAFDDPRPPTMVLSTLGIVAFSRTYQQAGSQIDRIERTMMLFWCDPVGLVSVPLKMCMKRLSFRGSLLEPLNLVLLELAGTTIKDDSQLGSPGVWTLRKRGGVQAPTRITYNKSDGSIGSVHFPRGLKRLDDLVLVPTSVSGRTEFRSAQLPDLVLWADLDQTIGNVLGSPAGQTFSGLFAPHPHHHGPNKDSWQALIVGRREDVWRESEDRFLNYSCAAPNYRRPQIDYGAIEEFKLRVGQTEKWGAVEATPVEGYPQATEE